MADEVRLSWTTSFSHDPPIPTNSELIQPSHLHSPLTLPPQGATPRELLLESCRRNNTDLLADVLSSFPSSTATAHFLNTTTDGLGSGALHIAAQYGAYDVLDALLDQEGVEIDLTERREGDTCLHKAVRYVDGLGHHEWESGKMVVDILIDAGCDPR